MTQPQAQPATQAATGGPVDPLADLRDDDDRAPGINAPAADAEPEAPTLGLVTPEAQAQAQAVVIAAWHADTVALGFLHKGGYCGCNYLSQRALDAAMPVTLDETVEPEPGTEDGVGTHLPGGAGD